MDRILVTSGSGSLGSCLLRHLLAQHRGVELNHLDLMPAALPVVNHLALVAARQPHGAPPSVHAMATWRDAALNGDDVRQTPWELRGLGVKYASPEPCRLASSEAPKAGLHRCGISVPKVAALAPP